MVICFAVIVQFDSNIHREINTTCHTSSVINFTWKVMVVFRIFREIIYYILLWSLRVQSITRPHLFSKNNCKIFGHLNINFKNYLVLPYCGEGTVYFMLVFILAFETFMVVKLDFRGTKKSLFNLRGPVSIISQTWLG